MLYDKLYVADYVVLEKTQRNNDTIEEFGMTDEITGMTPNEEPTKAKISDVSAPPMDEMPTMTNPLVASEQATQTMLGVDDVPEEATPVKPVAELVEVLPTTPQPSLTYEQFGALTEPSQPTSYPAMDAITSQPSNPVLYMQSAYAPQPGNPAMYTENPYVPQPGQPMGQAPVRQRRSPLLWMILIALVAFLLGGSSIFAYTTIQAQVPSPNATLQKYCDGVKTANAQEIYDTLSQQAKVHASLNDIQNTFNAFNLLNSLSPDSSMKYGNCTVSNLNMSGKLAVATVTLSLDMTLRGQTTSIATPTLVSLVLENNQWKVDFSSLAQPQPNLTLPSLLPTPTPASN